MKRLLLTLALLPFLSPNVYAQCTMTTLSGTFLTLSGDTPAQAGLDAGDTIASTATYGRLEFTAYDSSGRKATRILCSGVNYVPVTIVAWIKSDGTIMDADGNNTVTLVPTTGSTPTGLIYRLRVTLNQSAANRLNETTYEEQKALASGAQNWGNIAVSGITALTYTGYNQVMEEGSALTARTTINFIGTGVTCADASSRTECTFTGGSGAWESLTNTANTATSYTADNTAETISFDFTSAFTTGSQFRIRSLTQNPTGGTLFEVLGHDAQVTPFKATGDGTSGIQLSAAGILSAIGSGGITATTGDSATAFFTAGAIEAARGGTAADSSASTGVPRVAAGTWTFDAGISHLAASTSADLAGVLSNETGTGNAVFSASPTFTGTILAAGITATGTVDAGTLTEGGNAVPNATNTLGFFSATTSSVLAGVLSDETGTGVAVFGTSPTFTTDVTINGKTVQARGTLTSSDADTFTATLNAAAVFNVKDNTFTVTAANAGTTFESWLDGAGTRRVSIERLTTSTRDFVFILRPEAADCGSTARYLRGESTTTGMIDHWLGDGVNCAGHVEQYNPGGSLTAVRVKRIGMENDAVWWEVGGDGSGGIGFTPLTVTNNNAAGESLFCAGGYKNSDTAACKDLNEEVNFISSDGIGFRADIDDTSRHILSFTTATGNRTHTFPDANSNTVIPDAGTSNNFLTAISSGGVISKAQPAFTNISGTAAFSQGGTGLTAASDDTVMVSSGSAWEAKAIANCTDTGGQHLNYATATNAFSCGTSGGSGGAAAASNITEVTVNANVSTDQLLQEVSLSAAYLNTAAQPFLFNTNGIVTVTGVPTVSIKAKACTVSGCGSGTVVTLFTLTTAAFITAADNQFLVEGRCATKTTGATGVLICHAMLHVDLTDASVAANSYTDASTAASSAVDLTAAQFIQWTIAFSSASASNTATGQQAYVAPLATPVATSLAFSGVTAATNAAALVMGTGGSLTTSGSGTITATTAAALAANPADCAANNFATTIAANGDLTCAQVSLTAGVTGSLPVANGGTAGTTAATARSGLGVRYGIICHAGNWSPADGSVTYIPCDSGAPSTTEDENTTTNVPIAGTLTDLFISGRVNGTLGTTEAVTCVLRKNLATDSTDLTITTLTLDAANFTKRTDGSGTFTVAAGDTLTLKCTAPTFTTNPTNVRMHWAVSVLQDQ